MFLRILNTYEIHTPHHASSARSKSVKLTIIGLLAIPVTLRGFNGLGIFFFDGSFSLLIFFVLRKNKQNLSSRSLNFWPNVPSYSVHFTSSLSCAAVSNASFKVKVYKMMVKIDIVNVKDSLIQNIIMIVNLF